MNQWIMSDDEISPEELHQQLSRGDSQVLLVDVREPVEYEYCHLEEAVLIPLRQLPSRLSELNPDQEMVVYCHHGMRSMQAVQFLKRAGVKQVKSLSGGIDSWSLTIDPSVPRY